MAEFAKNTRESNCGQVQTVARSTVTASRLRASRTGEAGVLAADARERENYPPQLFTSQSNYPAALVREGVREHPLTVVKLIGVVRGSRALPVGAGRA